MAWNKPTLFDIVKIADPRGNLSVLQHSSTLPFEPSRVYWINDIPAGEMREGHAYYASQEVIIPLAGSFEVVAQTPDGHIERFALSRPNQALYLPVMTWRELTNFTTNSIALIVTNTLYDEVDYIRDKDSYERLTFKRFDYDE